MAQRIGITSADRDASVRGDSGHCLLATAARRSQGGHWTVTDAGAVQHIGNKTLRYRHTLGSRWAMHAFDRHLPFQPSSVRLVPQHWWMPPKAGRVAVAAGAGTIAWLIISGWVWLLLLIAGLAGAVFVGTALLMRRGYTRSLPVPPQEPASGPQWPLAGWAAGMPAIAPQRPAEPGGETPGRSPGRP